MLRIVFIAFIWIAAYRWSDWKNWRKYYPTILFMIIGDLLYNFFTYNYSMWLLDTKIANHTVNTLLLCFGFYPPAILIYLTYYPYSHSLKKQILYILLATIIFSAVEYIEFLAGNISYENGWNLKWSTLLNSFLFVVVALHHKKPLLAYPISIVIIFAFLFLFQVPLHQLK